MIKPRLRLFVCTSTIMVTLGGAVLTQAAGPGEFISRLWKRDSVPKKTVASNFSPFKWLRRDKTEVSSSRVRVSDQGRHVISERPDLISDPFMTETAPVHDQTSPSTTNAPPPGSKGVIIRPQIRKKPAPAQTGNANPTAGNQRLPQTSNNVSRTPDTSTPADSSPEQIAPRSEQSLPEVPTTSTPSAKGSQFVSGFDSEFQKLFKEVIEESRASKAKSATPRLPDDIDEKIAASATVPSTETATTVSDSTQNNLSQLVQNQGRSDLEQLIQQSRRQMEASVLARQAVNENDATPGRHPQRDDSGTASSQPPIIKQSSSSQSSVAAVSHSDSNRPVTRNPFGTGSRFLPQRLPDKSSRPVNQLIVPDSSIPEQRLPTVLEEHVISGDSSGQSAMQRSPAPDLQPVVRVVPGSRGAGVVIESGQWSPIKPRVSSNVAPTRSVPDTSQFRRLSFEGSDSIPQGGAIQAVGKETTKPGDDQSGQPALIIPGQSDQESQPAIIIPDSRTGLTRQPAQSFDAADLGAAFATAPEPPQAAQPIFEWPDESDLGVESPGGGISWAAIPGFLILGTAIGLFFRRKPQDGAFVVTGTRTES